MVRLTFQIIRDYLKLFFQIVRQSPVLGWRLGGAAAGVGVQSEASPSRRREKESSEKEQNICDTFNIIIICFVSIIFALMRINTN